MSGWIVADSPGNIWPGFFRGTAMSLPLESGNRHVPGLPEPAATCSNTLH